MSHADVYVCDGDQQQEVELLATYRLVDLSSCINRSQKGKCCGLYQCLKAI